VDKSIFKAYDIRGKYPKEIDEKTAEVVAAALAGRFGRGEVVIGHDARKSSPKLYRAAIRGFQSSGNKLTLVKVGLITTPLLYFLVSRAGARGGVMITASHNPKEYNGVKAVGANAEPISGKDIWVLVQKRT
jgi:phosphomannomutase